MIAPFWLIWDINLLDQFHHVAQTAIFEAKKSWEDSKIRWAPLWRGTTDGWIWGIFKIDSFEGCRTVYNELSFKLESPVNNNRSLESSMHCSYSSEKKVLKENSNKRILFTIYKGVPGSWSHDASFRSH